MRKKKRIVLWLLMLLILTGLFFLRQGIYFKHYANVDNGWNLILVNKNNYIPKDYKFELIELSNGEKVDSRIYPELQKRRWRCPGIRPSGGFRNAGGATLP